jgi:hypothetical protein
MIKAAENEADDLVRELFHLGMTCRINKKGG